MTAEDMFNFAKAAVPVDMELLAAISQYCVGKSKKGMGAMSESEKLFREIGFDKTQDNDDVIEYSNKAHIEKGKSVLYITFRKFDETYAFFHTHGTDANWIGISLNLNSVIQLQLKELGWL